MSEQINSFSDSRVGADYDGETLRVFKRVDGKEELEFEKKMSYAEAYGYYQSLRRSVQYGEDGDVEKVELIQDQLDKISGSLEKRLNALASLKKYSGRINVRGYVDGGNFISVRIEGRTGGGWVFIRLKLEDGKFVNYENYYDDKEEGGKKKSKIPKSIAEAVRYIEKDILKTGAPWARSDF
ncbi:hypothetical protein HY604_01105 [Candidatus Peregrinibacteria bacterium]|nr:hypothetical protein [Candidatus Peregrinibacteria bacterium]